MQRLGNIIRGEIDMKKMLTIVFTIMMTISLCGCGDKEITYIGNLGYDLSEIDYESIDLKIYHSNTDDHKWELLTTLTCDKKEDRFIDIRLEGKENEIIFTSAYNYVEKSDISEQYFSDEIDTYRFTIEGYDGKNGAFSHENYEIKDTEEEQYYRLYPISNDSTASYQVLDLNEPYDEDEMNLDNILITMTINKK